MWILQFETGGSNVSAHSSLAGAQGAFARYVRKWHPTLELAHWVQENGVWWRIPEICTKDAEVGHVHCVYCTPDAEIDPV
jgi:hypothetical protein